MPQKNETWQNVGQARGVIKKFNSRGDIVDEMIAGSKTFVVSPEERKLNEELAVSDELNLFKNGMFAPVRLLPDTDDAEEIASNPNLLTEEQMVELFKGNWRAFDARVKEIKNPLVLERMVNMAKEINGTVRQLETLQARLEEVVPKVQFREDPKPVTTR